MLNYARFLYWVIEREEVRKKKEAGMAKPWSNDMVFRTTYFCNVHREDDTVTKYIRKMYSPHVNKPMFEANIILSRFLNWPPTLEAIGFLPDWEADYLKRKLNEIKGRGEKVWGNAYVVTTHGIPMDKIDYLCDRVWPSVQDNLSYCFESCAEQAENLMTIEGISTFMAGQVIADLKNTEGHPLFTSPDWATFVLPGPGSRRGMDWLCGEKIGEKDWYVKLAQLQQMLYNDGWCLHAQDIQNCLCEYDKWERVINGTGRSKRGYNGI